MPSSSNSRFWSRLRLSPLFDRVPVGDDLIGAAVDVDFAPDVRVAADHLGVDVAQHIAHLEFAVVDGDLGVQHDLQQQIAQFSGQRFGARPLSIASKTLMRFFDQIAAQR